MELLGILTFLYLLFVVPALLGGLLAWLIVRKRIRILLADWLLLLLPWLAWLVMTRINDLDKTLSNLVEPSFVGGATALAFMARAAFTLARPDLQRRWAMISLLVSCLAAIAIWAFVPGLPE